MKHIKKFNNYEEVNEGFGLAVLAGAGLVLGANAAYEWARNFWSKNVVGSKYKETGKKETIITELPKNISPVVILSKTERDSGKVVTELKEYQDNLGNFFWGYDHLWAADEFSDYEDYLNSADMYTALFKSEDLEKLKSFLQNSDRYTGKYNITRPNPIEMIYREEGPKNPVGNY
jgi:hypothetical protein